jgi:hypothetical protein
MNYDNPFGDMFRGMPGLPGMDLQAWAWNPLHPIAVKLVTAAMAITALAYVMTGLLAR